MRDADRPERQRFSRLDIATFVLAGLIVFTLAVSCGVVMNSDWFKNW